MRLGKFFASLMDYAENERRILEAGILGTALRIRRAAALHNRGIKRKRSITQIPVLQLNVCACVLLDIGEISEVLARQFPAQNVADAAYAAGG
jgi:hypothetical protein